MGNINSYDANYINELQQRLADLQNQQAQLASYNQQLQQRAQQLQSQGTPKYYGGSISPSSSISLTPADQDRIKEILENKPLESKPLRGLLEDLL